jgi:two-component system, chemotaxis family, chemotaxis protein CheY
MRKALVVDDSKAIRLILSRTLTDLGYDVSSASNGKEAMETMNREPFVSVALVDWNMPVMNGLDFVKALRAEERFSDVKIVMVTTETEFEQMNAALAAGADDYVMKPFTAEIISERLQALEG